MKVNQLHWAVFFLGVTIAVYLAMVSAEETIRQKEEFRSALNGRSLTE